MDQEQRRGRITIKRIPEIAGVSYRWMLVGKSVIDCHVLEVRLDITLEKGLDHLEIEIRIDKRSSKIRFNHVGKTLTGVNRNNSITVHGFIPWVDPW